MMDTLTHCIQGKDTTTGKVGSFMYSNNIPFQALSPVFTDLVGLYDWLQKHGYTTSGAIGDLRIYKTEGGCKE